MRNSGSALLRFGTVPSSLLCDFISDSGEKGCDLLRDLEERESSAKNGFSLSSQVYPQYLRQSSASATQSAAIDISSSSPSARILSYFTNQNDSASVHNLVGRLLDLE